MQLLANGRVDEKKAYWSGLLSWKYLLLPCTTNDNIFYEDLNTKGALRPVRGHARPMRIQLRTPVDVAGSAGAPADVTGISNHHRIFHLPGKRTAKVVEVRPQATLGRRKARRGGGGGYVVHSMRDDVQEGSHSQFLPAALSRTSPSAKPP